MRLRVRLAGAVLVMVTAVYAEPDIAITFSGNEGDPIGKSGTVDEKEWTAKLMEGRDVLLKGDAAPALSKHINPVIAHYEKTYKESPKQIFCSNNNKQTLLYLTSAAVAADLGKEKLPDDLMPSIFKAAGRTTLNPKSETTVLSSTWAEAYYLKAYARIETGEIQAAQKELKKALYLSPYNATYWHELGHTHQMLKNWDTCVKVFKVAEEASNMSDEEYINADRARSWRGIGFAYIELGKIDDAEALFNKCLELNPDDTTAKGELKYIAQLQKKKQQQGN